MPYPSLVPGHEIAPNIYHAGRCKEYPDGSRVLMVADRAIFREPGYEDSERVQRDKRWRREADEFLWPAWEAASLHDAERSVWELEALEARSEQRAEASLLRAQRRARAAVRDLALSNDFRWFVTLTLDASRVDRYDVSAITRKLNAWADNAVRRQGLAYVLVPERHQDGAIHFHGLFNDALRAVDSGTVDWQGRPQKPRSAQQRAAWLAHGGHAVYNLPQWTLGFTTAIELYGDRARAVGYVCKYIGKQMQPSGLDGALRPGKVGGRWYYSGGALQRPTVTYFDAQPGQFDGFGGYEFRIPALGCRVKIIDIEKGGGTDDT